MPLLIEQMDYYLSIYFDIVEFLLGEAFNNTDYIKEILLLLSEDFILSSQGVNNLLHVDISFL